MKRANEELNKLKEIQKKKEAEEMERLERYAQEKEAEKQRRADFVERKKAEKEKQVQHMREVVRPPTPHRVALATMRCPPLLTGVVCVCVCVCVQMEADFLARQTNEDERLQNQAASARRKEDDAVAAKYVHTAVHAGAHASTYPHRRSPLCVCVCVCVYHSPGRNVAASSNSPSTGAGGNSLSASGARRRHRWRAIRR